MTTVQSDPLLSPVTPSQAETLDNLVGRFLLSLPPPLAATVADCPLGFFMAWVMAGGPQVTLPDHLSPGKGMDA